MTRAVEFSQRLQKHASWLSVVLSNVELLLGVGLLVAPRTILKVLVDSSHDEIYETSNSISTLVKSVARMTGGVLLAQGITCLALLSPILQISCDSRPDPSDVHMSRLAIGIQTITGLCWVIVALMDDHDQTNRENSNTYRQNTLGLLVVGFATLILACIALMMSFWPVDSPASNSTGNHSHDQPHQDQSETDMQPLLRDEETDQLLLTENTPYHLLEEGEQSNYDVAGGQEETSRVRGTLRLLKLARPQVVYLYIGCITLLIRLPFSLSIPHFVSTTLGALSRGSFHEARCEVFWLFLLGTIDAVLDFWCIFWFGYANQRIVRGVRVDTFAAILRQEVGFFDSHTSGELSSRLNSDCGEMAGDLTWFFRFSIESVVRITGITTYMFIRSPKLAACALSIAPIVASVNKLYGNWLSQNARKVQDALAAANSVAQETFSSVRTVIAFAAEASEHDKYVEKINEQYRLNIKQTYMTGVYYMFISTFLVNTIVQGTLLLVGSYMIQHGTLTGEVLLAFMLYQGQLQNEMMNLFQSYSSLIKSSGAGDKVFALLDRSPPAPATGSVSVQQQRSPSSYHSAVSIKLEDVSFVYPSRPNIPVLRNLSLTIRPGQTLALVGPSGCGKSTVVGLLQRFYDPTAGAITVNDTNLQAMNLKDYRDHIGVVTQDPALFSGTILSNICYGTAGATLDEAVEAAKMANAHDFITKFPKGYETEVGERGVQLSGGQKQRLAISRAILRNPSLLLLDEATSALDTESEEIVQLALDDLLSENRGITTVIIAHRLRTVRHCDAIAVLHDGKIVELGSHDELMASPDGYYKKMVEKSLGGNLATD